MFGSLVCGWACPFGLLQDLLGRIPLPKFRLPAALGWTRYAVLVGLVLVLPYFYGNGSWFFICRLCPAGALEAAVPYSVQQSLATHTLVWPTEVKACILIVFVVASLLTWRPWCTLLCPLGAVFSVCNYVSLLFLAFSAQPLQRLRVVSRSLQVPWTGRAAGERPPLHSLFGVSRCQALSVGSVFQISHPGWTKPPGGPAA